jgi:protein involved in polysaccharide export with SLBB domain
MSCNNYIVKFTSLSLIFCFLLSCPTIKFATPPESQTAIKDKYIIGAEDVLQVYVPGRRTYSGAIKERNYQETPKIH